MLAYELFKGIFTLILFLWLLAVYAVAGLVWLVAQLVILVYESVRAE